MKKIQKKCNPQVALKRKMVNMESKNVYLSELEWRNIFKTVVANPYCEMTPQEEHR